MSAYEPGQVAEVSWNNASTYRKMHGESDIKSERAIFTADGKWSLVGGWNNCIDPEDVTDIRPLVVLDLDAGEVAGLMGVLSWSADGMVQVHPALCRKVADQIEQQTKPPRIPEPGLWGVVEAGVKEHDVRLRWVRLGDNYRPDDRDEYDRLWCDLIDPTLVRPGIEDGAS
jgi:hypothetical protein